jgi:hypothetical protein
MTLGDTFTVCVCHHQSREQQGNTLSRKFAKESGTADIGFDQANVLKIATK